MASRPLTELECCVLGLIWERSPCTAYVIRQAFAVSPTPRWSSSAGSIYPLLERLRSQDLLAHRDERWGRGSKRQYVLTAAGKAAVRAWLGEAVDLIAAPSADPVRTRVHFLGILSPAKRIEFVEEALSSSQVTLQRLRDDLADKSGDQFEYLAARGTIRQMEARVGWLIEVQRALATSAKKKSRTSAVAGRLTARRVTKDPRRPPPETRPRRRRKA